MFCLLTAGCEGALGAPEGPQGAHKGSTIASGSGDFAQGRFDALSCKSRTLAPGHMPGLVRLTHRQYDNAVQDVLGVDAEGVVDFVADQAVGGYDNNAANLSVPQNQVARYQKTAETVAQQVAADLSKISGTVSCVAPNADAACRDRFIDELLKLLLRRPLLDEERTRYRTLFDAGKDLYADGDNFSRGVRIVIEAVLQSPAFLYRVELRDKLDGSVVPLTPHELAARMALTLWASVPDATLMKKADDKKLETDAQIEAEALRMLADKRAERVVDDFHGQWLEFGKLRFEKDSASFPGYDKAKFEASAKEEVRRFARHVTLEGGLKISDLFDAPFSFVDSQLASSYGISAPAEMTKVDLDASQRAGLFTQIAFLAGHADPLEGSPIHRGAFLQKRVLCAQFGEPPANVGTLPPRSASIVTTRQQVEAKTSAPSCNTCHKLINPAGFALESFDTLGKFRTEDHGQPVDSSGTLTLDGEEKSFEDAVSFAKMLAGSDTVRRCYETQWFRYALARSELDDDACLLNEIDTRTQANGGTIKELLVSIVLSRGFRFRSQEDL